MAKAKAQAEADAAKIKAEVAKIEAEAKKAEMQAKEAKEAEEKTELLKKDVKTVLSYLDQLLDALPEEKIKEFAESKEFDIYKKLFEELNIKIN